MSDIARRGHGTCPLCGRVFGQSLFGDTRYVYCGYCTLAKRQLLPKSSYTDEYYSASSSLAHRLFVPIERFFYYLRTQYVARAKKTVWIDVGAGDGGYLMTVPAETKIGVELSAAARRRMKQRGIEALSDQRFLRMKGRRADIISFWHVLEHTDVPWEYLRAAHKNLHAEGRIVVAVPNIESLEYRWFGRRWFHLVPQYHLWHVTPKSIANMLHQTGFRIISVDYWSLEHHLTGILQTLVNTTSGTDAALQKLVKRADGGKSMNASALFWSIVWMTVGAPVVLAFWLLQVFLKRPGTFVVVAAKVRSRNRKSPLRRG